MNASADLAALRQRLSEETLARQRAEASAEQSRRELRDFRLEAGLIESVVMAANAAPTSAAALQAAVRALCDHGAWPVAHALCLGDARVGCGGCGREGGGWYLHHDPDGRWGWLLREGAASTQGASSLPEEWLRPCPQWIDALADDEHFPAHARLVARSGLRSCLVLPVMAEGIVAAVLTFFDNTASADPSLLRLAECVATRLGWILEHKRAKARLLHEARHDVLTGLPNRAALIERLEQLLARVRSGSTRQIAVLFLDLDRFKMINDSLGHLAGDRLIVAVAERITACLRTHDRRLGKGEPQDVVARLGGDEFTVVIGDVVDAEVPVRVAERIQRVLAEPFHLQGQPVYTRASIGIALSADGRESVEELLRDADVAMYQAKEAGRGRWVLFDHEMHVDAIETLRFEADLHAAVKKDEFFLCYQPIVALPGNHIDGFEALVRWRHPVRGLVRPQDFIPSAEANGLILPIGQWVLEEACRQLHAWLRERPAAAPPLWISVNLSTAQLAQPDMVEGIEHLLRKYRLPLGSLRLELTESGVMEDPQRARSVLLALKRLGVGVSLDDFGTGYSSLSHVRRLPIDTVKIDRSFVSGLDKDHGNFKFTQMIVMLARALGLRVVAEGVNTTAELECLRGLGCDYVQGYLLDTPLDAWAASARLDEQARRSAEMPMEQSAAC